MTYWSLVEGPSFRSCTSTSFSISGVGTRVAPYSECTFTPVAESTLLAMWSPAGAIPRMPCSGPKSAVSLGRGLSATHLLTGSRTPKDLQQAGIVIGPGCITVQSGFAYFSFSVLTPKSIAAPVGPGFTTYTVLEAYCESITRSPACGGCGWSRPAAR